MRILITGTASGIGYETAKYFLEKGHEVIGIDLNKSTIDFLPKKKSHSTLLWIVFLRIASLILDK